MYFKSFIGIIVIFFIIFTFSCAATHSPRAGFTGDNNKQEAAPVSGLTIDTAITEAVSYFAERISPGAKVAIIPFNAPSGRLSDYVFEEFWKYLEDADRFVMVDRRNLERIDTEVQYQLGSGRVDDNSAVSITKQYGAEILIYGQISSLGNEYRMTVYATDVEKASSNQRAYNIRRDNRLSSLLEASADEEIERAIAALARPVDQRLTIAVGRLSYADTQTVSGFSAWLKNSIIAGAQNRRDKFQIATDTQSSAFAVATRGLTVEGLGSTNTVQAVIEGSFSPLDSGAEVLLQLVSQTGSRVVLSSARFTISASELERRRLSLLPNKGDAAISLAEFQANQQAISPYFGKNNKWKFTVTPVVLDGFYRDGDLLSMVIYSERDCYFQITHVDANGISNVIYPFNSRDDPFIRAGQVRTVPNNTNFRMEKPFFGDEMILVAAYERPFTANQSSGTTRLSVDSISRGLTVVDDRNTSMIPSATSGFHFTVVPR